MAITFGVARKILKRKKERERRKEREKCKFRSGQRYVRGISSFEFSWPADVETRHVTCKFSSSRDQLYEGKGKLNIATSRGSSSRLKGEKKGRRGEEWNINDLRQGGGGLFKRSFDTNETRFHSRIREKGRNESLSRCLNKIFVDAFRMMCVYQCLFSIDRVCYQV